VVFTYPDLHTRAPLHLLARIKSVLAVPDVGISTELDTAQKTGHFKQVALGVTVPKQKVGAHLVCTSAAVHSRASTGHFVQSVPGAVPGECHPALQTSHVAAAVAVHVKQLGSEHAVQR
jgi:hypothetical protein